MLCTGTHMQYKLTHLYFPLASVESTMGSIGSFSADTVICTPSRGGITSPIMKTPLWPTKLATSPGQFSRVEKIRKKYLHPAFPCYINNVKWQHNNGDDFNKVFIKTESSLQYLHKSTQDLYNNYFSKTEN